jgi:hypothetical protein
LRTSLDTAIKGWCIIKNVDEKTDKYRSTEINCSTRKRNVNPRASVYISGKKTAEFNLLQLLRKTGSIEPRPHVYEKICFGFRRFKL